MLMRILNAVVYVAIALILGAVLVRFLKPEWDQYAVKATWTGLGLIVLYVLGQWREILAFFAGRNARYGTLATVAVLVMIGLVIGLNYLSNRRNVRWDLTENSINSLSEQSVKVLSELKAPLKLLIFDQQLNLDAHRPRMEQYGYASRQVSVEYVDAQRDPVLARKYEIQALPTVVVEFDGKTEKVTQLEERELTGAIIRAVTGKQRKVFFVKGHGEKDHAATDDRGYSGVVRFLSADNVTLETLVLTQTPEVPKDASAVVIAGPTVDFLDTEIESVKKYLAGGGRLLLMLDPSLGESASDTPKLKALAQEWGVTVGDNVVIDVSGLTSSNTVAVATPPYPSHPVTERFNVLTVFPLTRSITAASTPPPNRTVQPLVETSQAAWAETDLAALRAGGGKIQLDKDKDLVGPVPVAVAVSTPGPPENPAKDAPPAPPQTRIAVFGDSDFASNAVAGNGGNADLLVNTINWLTAQENLIAIRPREAGDSRLTITSSQATAAWWLSVVGVPALVFGAGIVSWRRRRR